MNSDTIQGVSRRSFMRILGAASAAATALPAFALQQTGTSTASRLAGRRGMRGMPQFSPDTVALLKARGHDVDYSAGAVPSLVQAIVNDGGWLLGGADGRKPAKASGY